MHLPNIRKVFIPDEGMEFFDIDLDSADLRVVAWESGCEQVKKWFAEGKKPYVELMKEYFHDQSITKKHPKYGMFKSLCHGSNYLGIAKNLAPRLGLLVHETEKLQNWYFGACPEIPKWQKQLISQVDRTKTVSNVWGYKFTFYDRITSHTYNAAVAWIPQSTVGILINHAYVNIDKNLPEVEVLLQVHDSLAGQFPIDNRDTHISNILREAAVPLPYRDPLIIPVGIKTSPVSWGECE